MTRTGVFLDTSVLVGRVLKRSQDAIDIFNDPDLMLYTNAHALKETYHVLKDDYGFSENEIGYAIEYIRERCIILPTPAKEEFKRLKLRDRSDAPLVCSAMKYDLVMIVDDMKTYKDAGKYCRVRIIFKDKK